MNLRLAALLIGCALATPALAAQM
ncbi:MAG: hypothetical protein JWO33_1187, partial [Caulobacteraceae bacterium]|nr:hypothetical protein [Caulobacteraceae bacterium]